MPVTLLEKVFSEQLMTHRLWPRDHQTWKRVIIICVGHWDIEWVYVNDPHFLQALKHSIQSAVVFEDKRCRASEYYQHVWVLPSRWRSVLGIAFGKQGKLNCEGKWTVNSWQMLCLYVIELRWWPLGRDSSKWTCTYVLWRKPALVILCMILIFIIVSMIETFNDCCTFIVIVLINY